MILKNNDSKYVLFTAVKNEANYIQKTIESVIIQSIKPQRWVIVSDSSTDATDDIILKFSENNNFIQYARYENKSSEQMIAPRKVAAINFGISFLKDIDYEFIGCVDGDVTFDSNYFEQLISRMKTNSKLGLVGGYIYNVFENGTGPFFTSPYSVGGPTQFFRKECFKEIGGYIPVAFEDALANVCARMHGWKVRAFSDLIVYHHKPSGIKGRNIFKAKINVGRLEHLTGDHPLYQFFRSFSYINQRPIILSSFLRIIGYWMSVLMGEKILTPKNIVRYLRKEQMKRFNIFKKFQ